ncbi:MAG: hypothetical protein R3F61_13530 [Myxococcota bacterium]
MAALFALSCLSLLTPAYAQSEKTVVKAARLIGPDQDPEKIRHGFEMLSVEIRDKPDLASPAGLWLRADAAALLAVSDGRGLPSALVALESYERSVQMRKSERDLLVFARLESWLHDRAQTYEDATTHEGELAALEAAQLYLRADDIRISLDESRPVERARRYMLAVSAALKAGEVRAARKLFEELDAMGGFIEDLAISVARTVEEEESPHQAFLFLLALQESHPRHRKLLGAFTDLCMQNGWNREARQALEKSLQFYGDTYEDQMLLAGYWDALGENATAARHYEAALVHAPRGYDANWLLATLLQRVADGEPDPEKARLHRERAVRSLKLILESNPDAKDARNALESIQAALDGTDPEDPEADGTAAP